MAMAKDYDWWAATKGYEWDGREIVWGAVPKGVEWDGRDVVWGGRR